MATSTNRKLLYQLPQKQIHRAERRQNYDKSKSNVLVTTRGAAVSATAAAPTPPVQRIATHAPSDVASLPLLRPFHIKNVVDSPVVNTIINEQHAADTLVAMMKHEESLRAELQKARNEPSAADDDKKSGAKSKSSKKSSRKSNSGANSDRAKDLELQIETVTVTLHQCRQNLVQFAGWTKAMLQAEYSKLAVTLDEDSEHFKELEEAYSFFCPRPSTAADTEDCYEQRLAYVREMIPAMKQVGEKNFPTSLMALPYIRKFQCGDDPESPIVAALIDEMHQLAITEGVRARLEKLVDDPAKLEVLKHAEESLNCKEAMTSELVKRHYRKKSIKLHPDRNGERMRTTFEEFTDARTVLSDIHLRQSYLRGMLDVFKCYGMTMMSESHEAIIVRSHEAWNKKHRPDVAEDELRGNRRRDNDGTCGQGGEDKPLKLEGGLHQQIPRGVVLYHRRDGKKNHLVSVSIHALRPAHEFYARVRRVLVEMRNTSDEKYCVELSREDIVKGIKFDRQEPILATEIPVVEDMQFNTGHWEVNWCATLDVVGTDPLNPHNATQNESVTTRSSAIATFHVVDYDQLRKCKDFDAAEHACRVVKGELANTLHRLRTNPSSMNTPARFGYYHQILVRARKKCSNLQRLIILTGKSSVVHVSLSALLTESRAVFADLQEKVVVLKKREEKKGDVKRFKTYIASVLESEDPILWMKTLREEQLSSEGGDLNRFYQLLFEGKGKCKLLVDSEVYKEASLRDDMFSKKQCKDLATRGEEVAEQEIREEKEMTAAKEKLKEEEEEREILRKEAELRDKWALVGQNVKIQGLQSDKGKLLNHQMARVMYYVVDKDRFEVQLYNSTEKAYLKNKNVTVYYGDVPAQQQSLENKRLTTDSRRPSSLVKALPKTTAFGAWNCNECTFENDDTSIACSMCSSPKPKSSRKNNQPAFEIKNEKELKVQETTVKTTDISHSERKNDEPQTESKSSKSKTTIYVRSPLSKKLTGKRGRKKKDLMNKSGVDEIIIENVAFGNHIPVHLTGSVETVRNAVALIEETIGVGNVSKNFVNPVSPLALPLVANASPKVPVGVAPARVMPAPVAPSPTALSTIQKESTSSNFSISGMKGFGGSGLEKPANTGTQYVSVSESETQPTSQFSFGDALLPRGLMDVSTSTPATAVPPELPTEIGISSQGMTRESITEASVSSLNDRSSMSKTHSSFTLNENDPMLIFLRASSNCIKGSVEEFYIWLIKSEDIDSMAALKEAVTDDDYLNDIMKVGNGSSGLKGFKRKAFQRAVLEHHEEAKPAESVSNNMEQHYPPFNDSMIGNAFLPSNLFSNDEVHPPPVKTNWEPSELLCPIGLVLMVDDPVLAADGVTYERSFINDWFQKNMARIENLKLNPQSECDQRVISPAYGVPMKNLVLTPNTCVRNMARAYQERKDLARF